MSCRKIRVLLSPVSRARKKMEFLDRQGCFFTVSGSIGIFTAVMTILSDDLHNRKTDNESLWAHKEKFFVRHSRSFLHEKLSGTMETIVVLFVCFKGFNSLKTFGDLRPSLSRESLDSISRKTGGNSKEKEGDHEKLFYLQKMSLKNDHCTMR